MSSTIPKKPTKTDKRTVTRMKLLSARREHNKTLPYKEDAVKRAVKKRLNELGCYHFWPVQFGLGGRTVDCLGSYKGRFFGIETKAPEKKVTLAQSDCLLRIQAAGGKTFVIDTIEAAAALFTQKEERFEFPWPGEITDPD